MSTAPPPTDGQVRCKRPGCLKYYKEQQNVEGACHYHSGNPIFHDTKKGWTCCNKIVYDWDEFQKLPTCSTGIHTDKKPENNDFFKSDTVKNAGNALKKEEAQQKKIVIKDINQYNKGMCAFNIFIGLEQIKKKQASQNALPKKPIVTKQGKFKCINNGCRKDYLQQENSEDSCKYHKGEAVFHDLKKYWTCCNKQTHDWDEFMKLPTCSSGWHSPKLEK